jgi:hypothetical protein
MMLARRAPAGQTGPFRLGFPSAPCLPWRPVRWRTGSRRFTHPWWCTPGTCGPAQPARQRLIVSLVGSADAFMKLAAPCTILSLRAVTASFVFQS